MVERGAYNSKNIKKRRRLQVARDHLPGKRGGGGADKDIIGQQTRESRAQQERVKAASKNSALDAEY